MRLMVPRVWALGASPGLIPTQPWHLQDSATSPQPQGRPCQEGRWCCSLGAVTHLRGPCQEVAELPMVPL